MAGPHLLRHLKVLTDAADTGAVRTQKFFAIGNADEVEGEGEVLPLLSFVEENLSRFVVSNVPSTTWGRPTAAGNPAPFVFALPNRAIANKDAIFLISGIGQDRDEPNPSGVGKMHFVYLGARDKLWSTMGARVYLYKLEAVQTKAVLPPPRNPSP
jgi:hypothetical protein